MVSKEIIMTGGIRKDSNTSVLEAHLGYRLRRVSNVVSGSFARALQEQQVSVAEWVVLSQIHANPEIRPADLAERLGLTRGAVSKVLNKLEGKKWIIRKTLEADSRSQLLLLTRPGRRALPELTEIADRNDQRFFDCLDAKEKATLVDLLRKLTEFHEMRDVPIE